MEIPVAIAQPGFCMGHVMKWRYVVFVVAALAAGYVGISLFTNVGRPVKTHFDPVMP